MNGAFDTLKVGYLEADVAVIGTLRAEYIAADTVVTNKLTAAYIAADNVVTNKITALRGEFENLVAVAITTKNMTGTSAAFASVAVNGVDLALKIRGLEDAVNARVVEGTTLSGSC